MAGEYREVIPEGLDNLNLLELAEGIRSKHLMLAITNSIIGDVKKRLDLKECFIKALEFDFGSKGYIADKYKRGLESGSMIPVESFNGRTDNGDRYYAPNELYFTT